MMPCMSPGKADKLQKHQSNMSKICHDGCWLELIGTILESHVPITECFEPVI